MQQYLLNLEKGDLHQIRDTREMDKSSPSDRQVCVMTLEEFSNEKTIPHKTGFIRNLQHHSACKLEAFSDCHPGDYPGYRGAPPAIFRKSRSASIWTRTV